MGRNSGCRMLKWAIFGIIVLVSLQGTNSEQPTESECRPYIEKALKEHHVDGSAGEEDNASQENRSPTDELTNSQTPDGSTEDETNIESREEGGASGADEEDDDTSVDGDTQEYDDGSMGADTASEDTSTDNTTGEDDEEGSVEGDTREENNASAEGENQDDDEESVEGDTKEDDASVEGDTKEDEASVEGDTKEDEASVEGDTKEDEASVEGDTKEDEASVEGDTKEDEASVQGDTKEDDGSVEGDTKEDEASVEGDTKEDKASVEGDTKEDGGSVEGDTKEDDASVEGDTKEDGGSVEGDTKEDDASIEGDTKEDDASVEGDTKENEASVEGDTKDKASVEGDTKENEDASVEGDTKEDGGSVEGDTKEDDASVEGDTKEDDVSIEGDTKEDEASVEGDTKEDEASVEGDTKEDEASVEGDTKEASVEGDTKEDDVSIEGDTKEDEASVEGDTKEASVEGDTKEDKASIEGDTKEDEASVEGDTKEDASIEGDTKEEESVEGDTKEDASKDGDTKETEKSIEGDTKEEVSLEGDTGETGDKDDTKEKTEERIERRKRSLDEDQDTQEEDDSGEGSTPEEDLTKETIIPHNLRPRDHIDTILKLDEGSELEQLLTKGIDSTLKTLKTIYDTAIKPLEMLYKYRELSNRHFGDPEIFSKPLILFMGPWSGGKSSTINYLLNNEFKPLSLRTGAEPSPAYFNIMMYGKEEEVLDGTQLAADWTFSGLQKFGQGLLDRLRGVKLDNKLLEKVNIVEIPGILEIRKQVQRLFPFNDACQWFIDRADIIFLVYDPAKLDVGPETEAILDQLKGREYQTRIILNKADQVKPEELMRVQGTLIWNISPLMSSTEPPVMYSTSLWSMPYESGAPTRLLLAQERAMLRDLREAVDKRIENKISSARRFAVRVRNHAKMVDCYLTTYYNHKTFFGNKKKISDDIIENPQKYHIYEGLSTLTNISRYDLPDPDVYRDFFKINPLYEFTKLSETCTYFRGCPINKLDVAIAYDLPELVGKYKKSVEAAKEQIKKNNS